MTPSMSLILISKVSGVRQLTLKDLIILRCTNQVRYCDQHGRHIHICVEDGWNSDDIRATLFRRGCSSVIEGVIGSLVTSTFLYACESWTLTAELQRRIQAMEMRCCCKTLQISYKDHVTNEEVRAKTQQAIGPKEDLLTIVKRHKLQRYGHVSRSSGLAKTILQGTVKGGRRQGRQRKRWEDNNREWTGLVFA